MMEERIKRGGKMWSEAESRGSIRSGLSALGGMGVTKRRPESRWVWVRTRRLKVAMEGKEG